MRPIFLILVAVFGALVSPPANAGFVITNAQYKVKVVGHDTPCTANIDPMVVLQALFQGIDIRELFNADVTNAHGESFRACWAQLNAENVFIIDERGGAGFLPLGSQV